MSSPNIKKYDFSQSVVGLEAFIGVFEKRIQEIHDEIPVFLLNGGDDTYLFKKKFEKIDNQEIYQKNPRIVFEFDEVAFEADQNTNQYITSQYVFNEKLYEAQFRRMSTKLPLTCNFVTPNMVRGLEYHTMLGSILSVDNTFTYEFLGINHDASYNTQTYSFEKAPMDASSQQRVFIVKATIELQLQIMMVRYNTIKELDPHDINKNNLKIQFNINSKNNDLTDISILKNPTDECNCNP